MDTLWIVLTQIALLHTVRVKSATVSAGDDKPGRLGDSHNVSITCTYKLDTDESAGTMTIQRRKVTEGSFSNIASFNIPSGTSSYEDADLVDRADLILLEGSVTIRLNNILCDDAAIYRCIFQYNKNQILYPIESSMVLTIEGCKDGSYGQDCTKKCGMCDGVCDSVDGSCPAGCLEGYNGTWCDVALPSKDIPEKDQLCTCVAAIVGAAIGSIVLVVLLGVGIIVCLIRQGRLKWVQSPEQKEPVHLSQQYSTQMSSMDTRREVFEHAHVYNNDYAVMDSNTIANNKEYDVIQHKQYQNI